MHVNLLPKSFVWRRAIQRRLRQWCFFYGILLFALACWNVPLVQEWLVSKSHLQELQVATAHIRNMEVERIDLAKNVMSLDQKIAQLKCATTKDRTTSILGILVQGVYAADKKVQIQEMQLAVSSKADEASQSSVVSAVNRSNTKFISSNAKSGSDQTQPIEYRLTLRGIAIKSDAISTLVDSLQESKVFPIVELRSTHEQLISDQSVHEFQLECLGHE